MTSVDVAIIGSSPNALAAAARLAGAGKSVVVVEPSERVGSPIATEPFAPGFLANLGLASVSLAPEIAELVSEVERDRNEAIGAERVSRSMVTRLGAASHPMKELSLPAAFHSAVELLRALDRSVPPDLTDPGGLIEIGRQLLGLGERGMHDVLRLLFAPVRDFCAETELSESTQAVLAGMAARGRATGPFAPGSLFGAMRQFAFDDGVVRTGARGGIERVAGCMEILASHAGAEVRKRCSATVDVDSGVAIGVRLATGERISAGAVLSDLDARATFTRLVSPSELEPETKRALRSLRYRGTVARIHLALRDLPRFTGIEIDALRGTLVVAPGIDDQERAWDEAKRGVLPARPYIEVSIPTIDDPSLAPAGHHVVDLWVQHVPYTFTDRAAVLSRVLDTLAPYTPGLADLVLHHHVAVPRDLEARFGLTEGHLYGGELSLEQSFLFRPFSGCTGYQTPIRNLYLCGSAAHPGGYTGRSGWNCAGQVLAHQS